MSEPKFYTVVDIARFLGISENTVYVAVRSGDLSAVRIGKSIRISDSSFREWADRMTAPKPVAKPAPVIPAAPVVKVLPPAPKPVAKPNLFPLPKIDVVVSSHPGMIEWVKRNGYNGLVVETARRVDIEGKSVFGIIPFTLAVNAETIFVLRVLKMIKPWQEMTADLIDASGPIVEAYRVEMLYTKTKGTAK